MHMPSSLAFRFSWVPLLCAALLFTACDGAVVGVGPEGQAADTVAFSTQGVSVLQSTADPDDDGVVTTTGRPFQVTNGLIEVDGLVFTAGYSSIAPEGAALNFFFGWANRPVLQHYSNYYDAAKDSVNVGLFVYSDQPFDGAVEAGYFEGQQIAFSIGGHDVTITSRGNTPILGDGSRTPAWVRHVPGFFWKTEAGRVIENAIGSSNSMKLVLREDLQWDFRVEAPRIVLDGVEIKNGGGGVAIDRLGFFYVYVGSPQRVGLFIITNAPVSGAVEAGAFEGRNLNIAIGGHTLDVTTQGPALLGDGRRTPAYVIHDASVNWGNGITLGVSSELQAIYDNN